MDQNTFINTYIDVIINSLMEQIKSNLQLQTQVKVAEIVAGEKNKAIEALTKQISDKQATEGVSVEEWKKKYESAEANYSATMNKLAHMDNLLKQVGDMKQIIISKDGEIAVAKKLIETKDSEITQLNETLSSKEVEITELKASIAKTKAPKKLINKVEALASTNKQTPSLDDF